MNTKLCFLFGAGLSIPAGMPCMDDITNKVLCFEDVIKYNDETFYISKKTNPALEIVTKNFRDKAIPFISQIKKISDSFFQSTDKKTNYEHIFYIIDQIYESADGNFENPALHPLNESLIQWYQSEFTAPQKTASYEFMGTLRNTRRCIQGIIASMLSKAPERLDYLEFISDGFRDQKTNQCLPLDIFTLNHDMLLETYLKKKDIIYTDGFETDTNSIQTARFYNPLVFDSEDVGIRLFKLHGSINWFAMDNGSHAIAMNNDIDHTIDRVGNMLMSVGNDLIIGTHNKHLMYIENPIFIELFFRFYEILKKTSFLIIAGYGFGDKGINTRIIQWMNGSKERKILIINPKIDELLDNTRGAIKGNYDKWKNAGKLVEIPYGIEENEKTSWECMKEALKIH